MWFAVSIATTIALIAFALALGGHGLLVGRAARQMADEIGPITEEITQLTSRRAATTRDMGAKRAALRPTRTRR